MAISDHRSETSLKNYIGRPSSEKIRACSDILSDASSGGPRQSLQPSFTVLSSRAIFMFRWIRLSFIPKTFALYTLFSTCHVKKLACFYEPQFGWSSLNISLSDSVISRWLLSTFWSVHLSNCHERQTFLNLSLISFLYCWRWKDVREKSGSL